MSNFSNYQLIDSICNVARTIYALRESETHDYFWEISGQYFYGGIYERKSGNIVYSTPWPGTAFSGPFFNQKLAIKILEEFRNELLKTIPYKELSLHEEFDPSPHTEGPIS